MAGPRMTLFSYVFPQVRPGRHRIDAGQSLSTGDPLPARVHHLEVTSPRVTMPGSELFGVFPPPNAIGPFAGRLAQAVLRRRTLPWDRATDPASPWLALVVLAEGEANFVPDVPAAEAFTTGRLPADVPPTVRCAALEVPKRVIDATFPAASELELLCHARQVDVADTEYADEDGWVAVVLANRLPLPGKAYGAFLISLEGQRDVLPSAGGESPGFTKDWAFGDIIADIALLPRVVHGAGFSRSAFDVGGPTVFHSEDVRAAGTFVDTGVRSSAASALVFHDIDFTKLGDVLTIPPSELTLFRFPVLAHWQFSCTDDAGDFAGYMSNLDVGLLGTAPAADPRARMPETLPTGHLRLAHTDRRGDRGSAWCRGPFTPTKVTREPAGRPYHVADQARRIGSDGREDVSYAAAFEIGRLLAMSDLQFLRALRAWARAEFAVRRQDDVLGPTVQTLVPGLRFDVDVARLLTRDALVPGGIGGDPFGQLGEIQPLHEAQLLFTSADAQVIATGLGLDARVVGRVLGDSLSFDTVGGGVLDAGLGTFDAVVGNVAQFTGLREDVTLAVDELRTAADRLVRAADEGRGGSILDRLLKGGSS